MNRTATLLILLCAALAWADSADAQGVLERARRAAERGAERAVEREAERRADRAVTNAIECAVGDRACAERASAEGRDVVYVESDGAPASASAPSAAGAASASGAPASGAAGAAALRPGEGVWANYDFTPGDRVLFFEDYTADRVGNFPRRLSFTGGNIEIVEWEGGRWLRVNSRGGFDLTLPETLPERFTLEFDAYTSTYLNHFFVYSLTEAEQEAGRQRIEVNSWGTGITTRGGGLSAVQPDRGGIDTHITPVRIMADGQYMKVFLGERRAANVPNADLGRTRTLRFEFYVGAAGGAQPIFLGPIRLAATDRTLYDALVADGRVATQGILFDTGSARIRPESTPTLKDIADALRRDGDLRLRIEGHTDNVGQAAANLALSEQRAQAVVAYLVEREGVAAGRLEAAGLGDTAPSAENATPEGRQQNRRVELVVLR